MKKSKKNNRIQVMNESFLTDKKSFFIFVTAKVHVNKIDLSIKEEIDFEKSLLFSKYTTSQLSEINNINQVRELMRAHGKNPNRYPHSAESLIKRILEKKELYQINNVVDFNNLMSIKYLIPVGTYDFDEIKGDIILKIGGDLDTINSLKSDNLKINGVPALFDDLGAFGNIISDSKRTLIKESTTNVLSVFFFFKSPDDINHMKSEIYNLYKEKLKAKSINLYSNEENI